jgi:hypothetical protein
VSSKEIQEQGVEAAGGQEFSKCQEESSNYQVSGDGGSCLSRE